MKYRRPRSVYRWWRKRNRLLVWTFYVSTALGWRIIASQPLGRRRCYGVTRLRVSHRTSRRLLASLHIVHAHTYIRTSYVLHDKPYAYLASLERRERKATISYSGGRWIRGGFLRLLALKPYEIKITTRNGSAQAQPVKGKKSSWKN